MSKNIFISLFLLFMFLFVIFETATNPDKINAQPSSYCDNISLNTLSGRSNFDKSESVNFQIEGVNTTHATNLSLKILNEYASEALYSIPTETNIAFNNRTAALNLPELLSTNPASRGVFLIAQLEVKDENGEVLCDGDPKIQFGSKEFCPDCIELLAVEERVTNILGKMEGEVLQSTTQASDGAYFRFDYPPDPEIFTFKLTRDSQIEEVRAMLNGTTEPLHVAGIIRKWPVDYNYLWSYHLAEENITFFSVGNEFCDATIQFVENNLADVCDLYLPDCIWCPLGSRIIEEVEDPFPPACTETNGDANGDGVANGNDFTAWVRNFDPVNPVEGGTAAGDFNCDGYVNGNDFTRWLRYFTP